MHHPSDPSKKIPDYTPTVQTINLSKEDQSKPSPQSKHRSFNFSKFKSLYVLGFLISLLAIGTIFALTTKNTTLIKYLPETSQLTSLMHKVRQTLAPKVEQVKKTIQSHEKKPKVQTQTDSHAKQTPDKHAQKLLDLEQHLKDQTKDIKCLQQELKTTKKSFDEELQSIKKQLTESQRQCTQLQQMLAEHTEIIDKLITLSQEARAAAKAQESTLQSNQLIDNQKSMYSVHAIIRGRAWINNQQGKIVTIHVGSYIPNMGIVQEIDSDRGLIYFNTGEIIGPAVGDN